VFEAEKAMLERHGHAVEVYTRHSDEIRGTGYGERGTVRRILGMVKGAICTVGNPFAARAVAKKCKEFKPDVVHFHNTFPLISPLAVWAASKYAPVVMTLHNYRTACAAGVPTRDGKVCSLCLDKKCVWDGVRHRCYRGSLLATLPLAINIAMYRKLLPRWVKRFIVLSEFQKRKMVEYGWLEHIITVKGNFVGGRVVSGGVEIKKNQIVYVGRLSKEKGVETLIKAFKILSESSVYSEVKNFKLIIVGDGVDRQELEKLAEGLNVEFVGQKPAHEARRIVAESKALVSPSACWETFGLAAAEAMTVGVPSVVSNVGALPDIVQDGRFGEVFEAGNAEACAAAIKRLLERPDYDEMCAAAKHEAATKYSEEANYDQLMEIYADIV
jgi:glycosyltransferase involved in cell wall biosynthesis